MQSVRKLFAGKLLEQPFGRIKITGIYRHIKHAALRVDHLIGRKSGDLEIALDGLLLLTRQIEVNYIAARHVVLFDHILPGVFRTVVGEIHILQVVLGQPLILFL